MVHSGSNGGRKWRIVVYEVTGSVEMPVVDTRQIARELHNKQNNGYLRPVRAFQELIDAIGDKEHFDKDVLYFYPASKGFSFKAIGDGLAKISRFLNQPLVYDEENEKLK